VFSATWENIKTLTWTSQTISELKWNLKELNNEKEWLDYKLNILKWNKRLNLLFKKDLNKKEVYEIVKIVTIYRKINTNLNIILDKKSKNLEDITDIRKEIISERISFYKKLIVYIDKQKLWKYKQYIKSDIEILKDKKIINAKIDINKQKLETKVNIIKTKIKKHDKILNEKLKIIIKNKLEEKIIKLKNNFNFKLLTDKQKRNVLLETVRKINLKIDTLRNTDNKTTIILKKIEIYNMAIEKITELSNEY